MDRGIRKNIKGKISKIRNRNHRNQSSRHQGERDQNNRCPGKPVAEHRESQ